MKRSVFSLLVVLFLIPGFFGQSLNAQKIPTDAEIAAAGDDEKIEAAEEFFKLKMYFQSLRLWKSLLKDYPDNPRVNYMAGECQFFSGSERHTSLAYFEKTIGHISNKLKMDGKHVSEVPLDAYLFLGKAYHLNERFDDAMKYYKEFADRAGSKLDDVAKKDLERWISWTNNAKIMKANPNKEMIITNLGPAINTADEEYSPVLSLDENVLYFTSRRMREDSSNANAIMVETGTLYEDVYLSFKDEMGNWTKPKMMNFGNDVDDNEATVSVSADGTVVYIYDDKEGGGDLYSSSFLEGGYNAELEHMEGDINSKSWETHCSLTPDGRVMFFTSNRPGGIGGVDIYRMIKLPNGTWSKAQILPPPINTPYDEDAPFIHPSGKILYYSSNAPGSMGGCDVYYANIIENEPLKFSDPVNMGYPLNTVDDDVFFVMDAEGKTGYYSSAQNGGYGAHDIFMIEFAKPLEIPFAILKGKIIMSDGSTIPDDVMVNIVNRTKNEELVHQYKPRKIDGGFVMALAPCEEFEIEYLRGDKTLKKDKFLVPCKSSYQEIYKELYIDTLVILVAENKDTSKLATNNTNNTNTTNNTVDLKPAYYEKYFDYNIKDVNQAANEYTVFIDAIADRVKSGNKAEITIESSASYVPTTMFKTNSNLTKARAKQISDDITTSLKSKGVDVSKVNFVKTKTLVQGPAYKNDYLQNKDAYGKFQYVKVWMK